MSFSLFSNLSSLRKACRVAPSILSLKTGIASPRSFTSRYPVEELISHVQKLDHIFPCLVSLSTHYSGCSQCAREPFSRRGTGVLLGPKLVVTSAYVVADASVSQESSVILTVYVGSTAALNTQGKTLMTKPLAFSFANDLAVLELEDPEGIMPSLCTLASSPPEKENILVGIANDPDAGYSLIPGNVRAIGVKTVRAVAPWPRQDESGWIEHDWNFCGGSGVPPECNLALSREKVSGSVSKMSGSPWFNVDGIASWEVTDEAGTLGMGYAASSTAIRAVLDHAMARPPLKQMAMDRVIAAPLVSGT